MILQHPDPRLRMVCDAVEDIHEGARVGHALIEAMAKSPRKAIGLSAPQIGELHRVILIDPKRCGVPTPGIFINPEITHRNSRKSWMNEGCLSSPADLIISVLRPVTITMKAQDVNGRVVKLKLEGLAARCAQHEIDHLDGINLVDKAKAA